MSAFKRLKDISFAFEQQLHSISSELYLTDIGEKPDEAIAGKIQDLTLFTSKLRLLKAIPTPATPQIPKRPQSEDTVKEYEHVAMKRILEKSIVKSITQSSAVKKLIYTADHDLTPGLIERKEKIVQCLKEYRQEESSLRKLEALQQQKEDELTALRRELDKELSEVLQEEGAQLNDTQNSGPYYNNLRKVVDKLELIRWLMSRLIISRGSCDWLAQRSLVTEVLKLTREQCTTHMFFDITD